MVIELQQEIVCVGVILLVCVTLSVSCLILWMVRCRRDQIRHREGKHDRQRELDNFEDNKKKTRLSPQAKRKIYEAKKETPKKAETDLEKVEKDRRGTPGTLVSKDETIEQFETRMSTMEANKEINTSAKNRQVDTVSVIAAGSTETLQRNDSKVNVFPVERVEEMDLNPGLNGPINLEAI